MMFIIIFLFKVEPMILSHRNVSMNDVGSNATVHFYNIL